MRQRTTSLLGAMAFIVGVFASLTIHPRTANAACAVTTTGAVNCNANTKTTSTINFDGALSESSDRTQHFNNGSPINATVGPRVTVSGAGLHLTEGLRAGLPREPVTMNNRGLVTSNQAGNLLQLDGNGAPITYFGNGSLTAPNGTALYVDNKVGNVSITTGPAHIISGSQGISASTTQDGTVSVTTGSGSVKGSAGDGILARSGLGALTVTIRSGGVSSTGLGWAAIDASSSGGKITIMANGQVTGAGATPYPGVAPPAIMATSNGVGNITVGGSGTVTGIGGRGIWAKQSRTGLGDPRAGPALAFLLDSLRPNELQAPLAPTYFEAQAAAKQAYLLQEGGGTDPVPD